MSGSRIETVRTMDAPASAGDAVAAGDMWVVHMDRESLDDLPLMVSQGWD